MPSSRSSDTKTRILKATWRLLEKNPGKEFSMNDIAKASNISRQALYLHFPSRSDLMIATSHFVDKEKGLDERLAQFQSANTGIELLEACIEIWGNYIPEIYGLAKAMMMRRDIDPDMAAAWDDSTNCLRDACHLTIQKLEQEGVLSPQWTPEQATDIFLTLLSISNWAELTLERGWTIDEYVEGMKKLLMGIFIQSWDYSVETDRKIKA